MKLRIRGDSVRLRLTQSEIAQLAAGQSASQTTSFINDYVLRTALIPEDVVHMSARFDETGLTIVAPRRKLIEWAQSEQVTFECPQENPPTLLIEKDFACLVPRDGGDDIDTFEHPGAAAS